jgi:hypothetical protein
VVKIPYVSIPKDLTKVKTKFILGLTKRQALCFGSAAAVGVPIFFLTRGFIGNSSAVLLMMGVMLPAFFIAIYERDGQPAEKIILNIIRMRLFFPTKRPYKTENFYHIIEKEALLDRQIKKASPAGKAPVGKRKTVKEKQKRPKSG